MNQPKLAAGFIAVVLFAGCAAAPETPAPQPSPAPAPREAAPAPVPREAAPAPAPVRPAPAPVAAPRRCDAAVTLQNEELAPIKKADLTAAAKARLDRDVIGRLASCARVEAVVIESHTDRLRSQQDSQRLSEKRADNIKAYLIRKGVDANSIETLGMGKTVPAKFCPDSKNRKELIACLAPNNRVIITIKGPGK